MLTLPSDQSPDGLRGDTGGSRAWAGAGYSLHEFTRGPLWAESHEVIHTDDSPCVPVPAQGACGAKHQGHSDCPLFRGCPHALLPVRALPTLLPGGRKQEQGFKCWLCLLFSRPAGRVHTLSNVSFLIRNTGENAVQWEPGEAQVTWAGQAEGHVGGGGGGGEDWLLTRQPSHPDTYHACRSHGRTKDSP